ncbi:MAG: sulfurase, partial [Acidobacteria bacterium]|nr:sulfurase [Acidobacteriota bacterium]
EVKLQVTDPCPRCVMTTLPQGDLPKDPGILRTAVNNNVYVPFAQKPLPSVGVYAKVLHGGTIRRGDKIAIE